MQNCFIAEVLMKSESYIMLNKQNDTIKINSTDLQYIVEKLMYIVCDTQSNIIFTVKCFSQNLTDTQVKHIKTAKWVMWYLCETISYSLKYETIMCTD